MGHNSHLKACLVCDITASQLARELKSLHLNFIVMYGYVERRKLVLYENKFKCYGNLTSAKI